jgi:ketosteroid isomerase-like protein
MLYYLVDDPWPLFAVCGFAAAGFLIAMRATQDGRHLMRAGIAIGVGVLILIVDALWTTDSEKIAAIVYALGDAVRRSDAEAASALIGERVTLGVREMSVSEDLDVNWIRAVLNDVKFDYLHISRLNIAPGERTHMGKAEFRVACAGTYLETNNFVASTEWSLGFRRNVDGTWKITRITATKLPTYGLPLGRMRPFSPSSFPEGRTRSGRPGLAPLRP